MPTTTPIDLERTTHETITVLCGSCAERIGWIECPTGGWWAHFGHPLSEHDAFPDANELCAQISHLQQEMFALTDYVASLENEVYVYGA